MGRALLVGLIDWHVHGAMVYEVMDGLRDGLEEMLRFYSSHDVTGSLATPWAASRAPVLKALGVVKQVQGPV